MKFYISNNVYNFNCFKITNESDPNALEMEKNFPGFEIKEAAKNSKYVIHIPRTEGGGKEVLSGFRLGRICQP